VLGFTDRECNRRQMSGWRNACLECGKTFEGIGLQSV